MKSLRFFAWPALLWFGFFIFGPLLLVFIVSFLEKGTYGGVVLSPTFAQFSRAFSWTYLGILWQSIQLALWTTLGCLVCGVLCAWSIATSPKELRPLWVALIALPFLTNQIIRIYAIRVFIGYEGPVQSLLQVLQIPFNPFSLSQNNYLVMYGMLTTYLPFMVLPVYAAFEKFDFSLVEAAQDLGAQPRQVLFNVILPGIKKALISGSLLVFVPCLGEFVIPDLLGGAKSMLFGNLITEQFLKSRNWPFGAALAVLLILILLSFWLLTKAMGQDRGGLWKK